MTGKDIKETILIIQVKLHVPQKVFKQNIDEQLIMEQTGHRSQDAVREYKRSSAQHALQYSDILQPPIPKKFETSETLQVSKMKMHLWLQI